MKSSSIDKIDIRAISIFKNLSFDEQEIIRDNISLVSLKKGMSIYECGTKLKGIYCIWQGVIKQYNIGSKGKDQIFFFLKKGDVFGYDATLNNKGTDSSAKAVVDCELVYIPGYVILKMFKENPKTRINVIQSACMELSRAQDLTIDIAQKSNKQRIVEFLFDMEKTFDVDDQNMINVAMKRSDFAHHIGACEECTIRIISDLKKNMIIKTVGKRIGILDPNKLKQIGF